MPTVLGWGRHEEQWRGTAAEANKRRKIIEAVYRTDRPDEAQRLMEAYDLEYVYIGSLERSRYGASGGLEKFKTFMKPVFENKVVTIYQVIKTGL